MLIRHATLDQIREAARAVHCEFKGTDNGLRFPRVTGRLLPGTKIDCRNCGGKGTEVNYRTGRDIKCRTCNPIGSGWEYPYQRVSASAMFHEGRRVHAVCWHGFRDFYRELFNRVPEATAETSFTRRLGIGRYTSENFEDVYFDTAYINVGSMAYPMNAAEVCSCGEGSY